jgi:hypothetical protein
VIVCTLALAEKETALLWTPALVGLWLVRHRARGWRKEDLLFVLPPLLFIAGFCVLSRSFTLFFIDVRANFSSLDGSSYVAQYMSGPLHRYPFDLFLLAPIVFLLAVAASGVALMDESPEARGLREAALLLALGLAVWVNTPKDVRYVAAVDGLLRILAAWLLVALASRRRRDLALVALLLCVNFGWELRLFHRVSVERAIYDPTTFGILNALDAIPR